jgi:hypothetical protein
LSILKNVYENIFQHGNVRTGTKAETWRVEEGKRHYDTEDEIEDEDGINQIDFKEAI